MSEKARYRDMSLPRVLRPWVRYARQAYRRYPRSNDPRSGFERWLHLFQTCEYRLDYLAMMGLSPRQFFELSVKEGDVPCAPALKRAIEQRERRRRGRDRRHSPDQMALFPDPRTQDESDL